MKDLREALPYLRRYGRALTGNQKIGDGLAEKVLQKINQEDLLAGSKIPSKILLFRVFHQIWSASDRTTGDTATALEARAQKHLASLTPGSREALLLSTIERFSLAEVCEIMELPADDVTALIETAHTDISKSVAGKVLIVEDEAVIAMDIENIITDMQHEVFAIAATKSEAVALAKKQTPDLLLADIKLADGSSGVDAAAEILKDTPEVPVIFITAYPERLLSGERPEPAFLIVKPYTEAQVRSAVSQAMFFASTDTLTG